MEVSYYLFRGNKVTIPYFCKITGKSKSNVYGQIKKGRTLDDIADGIVIRKHTNNRQPKRYIWQDKNLTVKEIANLEHIDDTALYRALQSGLTITDAIEQIKSNQPKLYPYQGKMLTRAQILKLNPDVSRYKLYLLLRGNYSYTEDEVLDALALSPRDDYYKIGNVTLHRYCIEMKYNYTTIYYLVKRKQYTVEEAIQLYLKMGQGTPLRGEHIVGEVLINHFCIMEQFDPTYVMYYLARGEDIKDIIIKCCFNSHQNYGHKNIRSKLCSIYNIWVQLDEKMRHKLEQEYDLLAEDVAFMKTCDERIKKAMREYQILLLAHYLEFASNDKAVQRMLQEENLAIEDALQILISLYGQFELILDRRSPIKYKWNNPLVSDKTNCDENN